ncbi:MAG: DUF4185 domain-containing protein [Cyclobacteriaceae bacterium]
MQKIYIFILVLTLASCGGKTQEQVTEESPKDPYYFEYTTEAAPKWTNLFYRKSGWFAADGIFSIPLDGLDKHASNAGKKTLLIFSDTYIGEVENNKPLPGNVMVNNTVAYFKGLTPSEDSISFHYKKSADGSPETFFVPDNPNAKPDQYFWLGDGFINKALDNRLYVFAYHVAMTGPNVFDFELSNVTLLAIDNPESPPFDGYRQIVTPLNIESDSLGNGELGSGVFVNTDWGGASNPDGYIYVYGAIGQDKNLVAARVKPEDFEDFDRWTYWTGNSWSSNIQELGGITNGVSNELSVTPLKDGRYLLIYQIMGISDKVGLQVGQSPVGPFGPINEIWTTPEVNEPPGILPYNAKAHPNISSPGELLISYNTITHDFWNDIQENAHIYRPRFIKLKSEMLK